MSTVIYEEKQSNKNTNMDDFNIGTYREFIVVARVLICFILLFNHDAGNTSVLLYTGRHCVCPRKYGTLWSNWIVQRRPDVFHRMKFTLEKNTFISRV